MAILVVKFLGWGIQSPIDVYLKGKCSEGFFDFDILKWNVGEQTKFGPIFTK